MNDPEYEIIGKCFSMCPDEERELREREGLLHVLEIDEKTKNLKRPKADPSKTVKCYNRSSAGMCMNTSSQLRPAPVLSMTLKYLLTKVATRMDIKWFQIYEFIFDRIRAVRQDITIQRLNIPTSILLYEPIVKFYIYSNERLCEESSRIFVPKFNNEHLSECIKKLLTMYDEDEQYNFENSSNGSDHSRVKIEELYILLHLGDHVALSRGLSLPKKIRKEVGIQKALEISLAWHTRNYVKVCREIKKLPPLPAIAGIRNLQRLRRDTFEIMSSAYNIQNQTFPILKLKEILLYENLSKLKKDCECFGFENFIDEGVCFQKKKFNSQILMAQPEQHIPDEVLHNLLPDIFYN